MDLNPYALPEQWKADDHPVVPLSAINNMNIPYLLEVIGQSVTEDIPADIPMISSLRHYHALDRTEMRLRSGLEGIEDAVTTDFVAQDIRQALFHLGEITGEISSDDILGNIFSRFCIGK
jgi:tRNA modification GTPase